MTNPTTTSSDDPRLTLLEYLRAALDQDNELLLACFRFNHLQPALQQYSVPFFNLAYWIAANIPAGPERTVALRKLLEAKDAAVRAVAMNSNEMLSGSPDDRTARP
jgi:hypothetical protein